jgi:predicted transcriptional regulator
MANIEERFLLKEKQAKMMIALADKSQKWNLSSLAIAAGVTYVHTSKFISACEKLGIVTSEKHGRIKNISITPKGLIISNLIVEIMAKIASKNQE